ncbi:hypothetical protein OJF2_31460 [Aquisphaera giovannonii]|uniref:Uncharacterized protein n=1 Tax=Aquisphaera giovannonii TaxID=406548 RepID=A0A5B9W3G2_9BACT|nr:hypothetical protein [Aquisphaera giovannonii]QEH34605.1 hypothetical protein OJF2_31460 [Aquisphaera giovannonii]
MPIDVECPACTSKFNLGEEHAGRRVKCPKCRGSIPVPSTPEADSIQAGIAFEKFTLDAMALTQPLPLPAEYPPAPKDLAEAKAEVIDARRDMQVLRGENLSALLRWNTVHPRAEKAEAAALLLRAGLKIKAEEFELDTPTLAAAEAAVARWRESERRVISSLEPFAEALARRLAATVGLLERDDVAERGAGGPARRVEARAIYPTAAFLATQVAGQTPGVMSSIRVLAHLVLRIRDEKKPKEALLEAAYAVAQRLLGRIDDLRRSLGRTTASFIQDEDGPVPLARLFIPEMPAAEDVINLMEAADQVTDRIFTMYRHVLGRLAVSAEEVERLLGLPPLKAEED